MQSPRGGRDRQTTGPLISRTFLQRCATPPGPRTWRPRSACRVALVLCNFLLWAPRIHAIDFKFVYIDPPNTGFFDPVLGAQRRAAIERAGAIWGSLLQSSYEGETIVVYPQFDPDPKTFGKANSKYYY